MDIVYALATVYNFININKPDNLDDDLKIEDKVIDKEDIKLTEVKSNIVMN